MPYLLIFGLSSLSFNHHFDFLSKEGQEKSEISAQFNIPDIQDNLELANTINDSINIFGWYLPWSAKRDSLQFVYETAKLGRTYTTTVDLETGKVDLKSKRGSVGGLLKGLHGLGETIPLAPSWVNLWQFYMDLSVYSLVFWLISGIWLWLQKGISQRKEKIVFYAFMVISLSLMLYIWLVG